jgi:hypothetical protein
VNLSNCFVVSSLVLVNTLILPSIQDQTTMDVILYSIGDEHERWLVDYKCFGRCSIYLDIEPLKLRSHLLLPADRN